MVKEIYILTATLPKEEKFGLVSQINLCSVSISSNIVEVSGRASQKEFLRFLNIAISSSYELETQLILVEELFNIDTKSILRNLETLQKMISAFKRMLRTENKIPLIQNTNKS